MSEKSVPVSCIPSPESPEKRITTSCNCSTFAFSIVVKFVVLLNSLLFIFSLYYAFSMHRTMGVQRRHTIISYKYNKKSNRVYQKSEINLHASMLLSFLALKPYKITLLLTCGCAIALFVLCKKKSRPSADDRLLDYALRLFALRENKSIYDPINWYANNPTHWQNIMKKEYPIIIFNSKCSYNSSYGEE